MVERELLAMEQLLEALDPIAETFPEEGINQIVTYAALSAYLSRVVQVVQEREQIPLLDYDIAAGIVGGLLKADEFLRECHREEPENSEETPKLRKRHKLRRRKR